MSDAGKGEALKMVLNRLHPDTELRNEMSALKAMLFTLRDLLVEKQVISREEHMAAVETFIKEIGRE